MFPLVFYKWWLVGWTKDSLRLSTKDVEHGLHGGGHVI